MHPTMMQLSALMRGKMTLTEGKPPVSYPVVGINVMTLASLTQDDMNNLLSQAIAQQTGTPLQPVVARYWKVSFSGQIEKETIAAEVILLCPDTPEETKVIDHLNAQFLVDQVPVRNVRITDIQETTLDAIQPQV